MFEDHQQTAVFWAKYYDGDQCESAPCGNGGNCTDLVGGFYCSCPTPFYGETCESGPESGPETGADPVYKRTQDSAAQQLTDSRECPALGPEACSQICMASDSSFICSCLPGYTLGPDRRTCQPQVEFPCGQIPDQSNSSDSLCPIGSCPWTVTVLDRKGVELCSGSVLESQWILTSARCLYQTVGPDLDQTQVFIRFSDQRKVFSVQSVQIPDRYSQDHQDWDLALIQTQSHLRFSPALSHLCVPAHRDFAENVLMHAGKAITVDGGRRKSGSNRSESRLMTLEECREKNISHSLSNKMFCLKIIRNMERDQGQIQDLDRNQDLNQGPRPSPDHRIQDGIGIIEKSINNSTQNGNGTSLTEQNQNHLEPGQTRTMGQNKELSRDNKLRETSQNGGWAQNGRHSDSVQMRAINSTQTGPKQNPPGLTQVLPESPHSQTRSRPGLLPGTPAVSVEQGTAYLVGLLTSTAEPRSGAGSTPDHEVLIFTKLSRHMTWLQHRLSHMTPQVTRLPAP